MTPTIGRIVIYKTTQDDRDKAHSQTSHGKQTNISAELPAIITSVFSDTSVNLQVFEDGVEGTSWKTSINEGEGEGNWSWPVIKSAQIAEPAPQPSEPVAPSEPETAAE